MVIEEPHLRIGCWRTIPGRKLGRQIFFFFFTLPWPNFKKILTYDVILSIQKVDTNNKLNMFPSFPRHAYYSFSITKKLLNKIIHQKCKMTHLSLVHSAWLLFPPRSPSWMTSSLWLHKVWREIGSRHVKKHITRSSATEIVKNNALENVYSG